MTRAPDSEGIGVVELLVVLAILGIVAAAAVPGWTGWRDRQRLKQAVWHLQAELEGLRAAAARDGRNRALLFAADGGDLCWRHVLDGDGDGVRSADVSTGRDRIIGTSTCLAALGGGVSVGVGPRGPARGPGGSAIPADGLALPGDLMSVAATGAGSSGTIYLFGRGTGVAALRLYGPTGRLTAWLYRPARGGWVPGL